MPIKLSDLTGRFMRSADKAGEVSTKAFPNQSWDNSEKNAARHSIWMALLANDMGGGPIARGVAKGVGYANEGIGLINGNNLTADGAKDMRHDLNNNAVGLDTLADLSAQGPTTEQQIIDALIEKSRQSKRAPAPSVLAPSVGALTRGQ